MVEGKQDPHTVLIEMIGDRPSKGVLVRRLKELPKEQLRAVLKREVR